MKLVAAYLLASMGGNPSPTKEDVLRILDSVGAEVEESKLELFFKEAEGKDVAQLLAAGREKFAYVPSGAGAVGVPAAAAAAASAGGAAPAEKKEEKAEEKMEEEEDDALFSLFDD